MWALVQSDRLQLSCDSRWLIVKNMQPISEADEPPQELTEWSLILNAANTTAQVELAVVERAAIGNQRDCVLAAARDRWVPIDDRGRWLAAFVGSRASGIVRGLAVESLDEISPKVAKLLHDHYGTEPVSVTRQRQKDREESEKREAKVARKQADAKQRQELLKTVAENLVAPSAASVEKMLPALATLLGIR